MTAFDIRPYDGAGPLVLGMSPAEVHASLGQQPRNTAWTKEGERDEDYPALSACYSKATDTLVEFALTSRLDVRFQGVNLFTTPAALGVLAAADGGPLEGLGSIVFPALGIAVIDFDSDQESDRVVSIFQRGRWDAIKHLKPYAPTT